MASVVIYPCGGGLSLWLPNGARKSSASVWDQGMPRLLRKAPDWGESSSLFCSQYSSRQVLQTAKPSCRFATRAMSLKPNDAATGLRDLNIGIPLFARISWMDTIAWFSNILAVVAHECHMTCFKSAPCSLRMVCPHHGIHRQEVALPVRLTVFETSLSRLDPSFCGCRSRLFAVVYSRCRTTTKPINPSMTVFSQGCSESMIVT